MMSNILKESFSIIAGIIENILKNIGWIIVVSLVVLPVLCMAPIKKDTITVIGTVDSIKIEDNYTSYIGIRYGDKRTEYYDRGYDNLGYFVSIGDELQCDFSKEYNIFGKYIGYTLKPVKDE